MEQLLELGSEQVAALSDNQINSLLEPKARAIRSVQNEDPKEDDPYNSGKISFLFSLFFLYCWFNYLNYISLCVCVCVYP